MLTFGSLFAGIGGMDLGFERAGMVCKWQVEIDEFSRRILAKHWPHVTRWDDVRTFPPPGAWNVDVIAGGFPCKQTSVAAAVHGRRSGLAGQDSGLWYEMLRIIRGLQPEWAVVENPPGAKTWSDEITGGLADAGYTVSRLERSVAGVGGPHLRRRVFWVANRHGKRLPITRETRSSTHAGVERRATDRNSWLSTLPSVVRVDDGVPGGLDRAERIKRLGLAVSPPVAESIAREIMYPG